MTLPAGQISVSQINSEVGQASTHTASFSWIYSLLKTDYYFPDAGVHTFVAPPYTNSVSLYMYGAGGGGGNGYWSGGRQNYMGGYNGAGGAGGNGAYVSQSVSVTPGGSYTVVVGNGGAQAPDYGRGGPNNGASGSPGGSSTAFGYTAAGGAGGYWGGSQFPVPNSPQNYGEGGVGTGNYGGGGVGAPGWIHIVCNKYRTAISDLHSLAYYTNTNEGGNCNNGNCYSAACSGNCDTGGNCACVNCGNCNCYTGPNAPINCINTVCSAYNCGNCDSSPTLQTNCNCLTFNCNINGVCYSYDCDCNCAC